MAVDVRVLGPLEVRRGEAAVPLPRSKKTRALLAYLALEKREHRRDRLTELLWDVTDDPRGALRWSLSKLRKVVDEGDRKRVVATRTHVALRGVDVDLRRLERAVRDGLADEPTEALFALAHHELLEGLALPDFDDFEAWLRAQRARATSLRLEVLRELSRRPLPPEETLRVARTWALLAPDDEAAQAFLARQQEPRPTTPEANAPPGRGDDLAWLWEQLTCAERDGRARVVLVEADPGLGKTTLLDAFAGALGHATLLRGCGYEAARGRPLGLWDELEADARVDDPVTATAARLERLARDGTAAVIVDDAHLADPSSAMVLRQAARARGRLLVVLAARPAELSDNAPLQRVLDELSDVGLVHRRSLEPLDDAVLAPLVDQALDDEARRAVLARSGGNPLFVRELSRARSEAVDGEGDLGRTVRLRVARLGERVQRLLEWAAILDHGSWSTLGTLAGASDLADELDQVERYGFLVLDVPTRSFRWSHALLRDAVAASIPALRRVEMHAAAVDALEAAHADPGLLAYHAERAASPERAAEVSLAAARRCAIEGGVPETVHYARRAMAFAAELPRRRRVEIEIAAHILLLQVDRTHDERGTAQLERLALEALDLEALPAARDAFYFVGSIRWERGEPDIAWSSRRVYLLGSLDGEMDALSPARSAFCLALLERDFPRIEVMLQEAEDASRRDGTLPPELPLTQALLAEHRGDHQAAQEGFADARLLAKASGAPLVELHALERLVRSRLSCDDADGCRVAAQAAADVAAKVREGGEAPVIRGMIAVLDGEEEELARQLADLERLDDKRRLAFLHARRALHATGPAVEESARMAIALGGEVAAPSDRAIAASIALTHAAARGDDRAYAELEDLLATLETEHVLSHEARTIIATKTSDHAPRPR